MPSIQLSSFSGADDRARFAAALSFMRQNPGTTLHVEPGVYTLSTPLSIKTQRDVMSGAYGENPEPIMFRPDFAYDRGLDFAGIRDCTVQADGATLLIDGFMEPISLRQCQNITLRGLTIDHVRKPYSRGRILSYAPQGENAVLEVAFPAAFPITPGMPMPRFCTYQADTRLFAVGFSLLHYEYIEEHTARFTVSGADASFVGRELVLWHTYHSRPAILLHQADGLHLQDITIHSQPGMGMVGQQASNITIERLRVVPSLGEPLSTNTDATHFASCRGKLTLDSCQFEGQGDDSINVHTYYYTVEQHQGAQCRLSIQAPTGTHAQALDYPLPGDQMELTQKATLLRADTYTVLSSVPQPEENCCLVQLDRQLPSDCTPYFLADIDELPELTFTNCFARNHFARSILIKCRHALIENCMVYDCFEAPIKIAAEAWWHEGISSADVTVRRCRFIHCGRVNDLCGGVQVFMDCADQTAQAHQYVCIEDNIIDCPNAQHGILIANTQTARVHRNQILSRSTPIVISPDTALLP